MTTSDMSACRFGPITVGFDDRVLRPRDWTLAQSEWAAQLAAGTDPEVPILELCAGAGHIGLAAAVLADRGLVQVEADPVAAQYAVANAERAGWAARVDVRAVRMEVALRAGETFAVVLADPPYLPTADVGRWPEDPLTAIDGGPDGLDLIRVCLGVAAGHLAPAGHLLLQVAGPAQGDAVAALLRANPAWDLQRREQRMVDDQRGVVRISRG